MSAPSKPVPAIEPPPLNEGRWMWRRLYVFAASLGLGGLLVQIIRTMRPEALPRLADGIVGLIGLLLILYLVAPTAQQMVELLVNLKLRLSGGRA